MSLFVGEVLRLEIDAGTWTPEVERRTRGLLEDAGRILAEAGWAPGAADVVADQRRQFEELLAHQEDFDTRLRHLEEQRAADGDLGRQRTEQDHLLRARYRWGLRVVRFALGVAIGSVIAGPLVALVPWPAMVGEVVKGAIGGAAGVLTSEISDPASDRTEQWLRDRERERHTRDSA